MASEICAAFKAPFWSCLLANTSRMESLSSSSCVSTTAPKSQFRPREHREEGAQPAYLQHGVQLLLGDVQSIDIGRVHDVDQRVRVGVVAPPVGADAGLPAQVPDLELDVLVLQRLHIEADGGHSLLDFIGLQTVCQRPHTRRRVSLSLPLLSSSSRKNAKRASEADRAGYVHRMVVLPALSRPRIRMRTSLLPKSDAKTLDTRIPMLLLFTLSTLRGLLRANQLRDWRLGAARLGSNNPRQTEPNCGALHIELYRFLRHVWGSASASVQGGRNDST